MKRRSSPRLARESKLLAGGADPRPRPAAMSPPGRQRARLRSPSARRRTARMAVQRASRPLFALPAPGRRGRGAASRCLRGLPRAASDFFGGEGRGSAPSAAPPIAGCATALWAERRRRAGGGGVEAVLQHVSRTAPRSSEAKFCSAWTTRWNSKRSIWPRPGLPAACA